MDITPLELADPASPRDWSDEDLRPVAVRVKVRNLGEDTLDLLSVVDAQLIDLYGRRYDAHPSAEMQPSFDDIEDLDPGETVRAWIVFGLPSGARPAVFTYQPFAGETGVWAFARSPGGQPRASAWPQTCSRATPAGPVRSCVRTQQSGQIAWAAVAQP